MGEIIWIWLKMYFPIQQYREKKKLNNCTTLNTLKWYKLKTKESNIRGRQRGNKTRMGESTSLLPALSEHAQSNTDLNMGFLLLFKMFKSCVFTT